MKINCLHIFWFYNSRPAPWTPRTTAFRKRASASFSWPPGAGSPGCLPPRPARSPCASASRSTHLWTTSTASTRSAIRHLRDKATAGPTFKVLDREVFPQAPAPHALREPRGQWVGRRRSRQQGLGQPAHEAGRHASERRRRSERPHPQSVGRTVAWRLEPRTKIKHRTPLDREIPARPTARG